MLKIKIIRCRVVCLTETKMAPVMLMCPLLLPVPIRRMRIKEADFCGHLPLNISRPTARATRQPETSLQFQKNYCCFFFVVVYILLYTDLLRSCTSFITSRLSLFHKQVSQGGLHLVVCCLLRRHPSFASNWTPKIIMVSSEIWLPPN